MAAATFGRMVGRNYPCRCGSGKKYKRCCFDKDRMSKISDLGARDEQGRLHGRPLIDTVWQGKRLRAVGIRIYLRPKQETKQEFFVHVMAHTVTETLGEDWKRKEDALSEDERHPLALWTDAWDAMRRDHGATALDREDEGGGQYSSEATGNALALLTTAYDVYTLRHAGAIDAGDPIIKRLGQRDQFQGARYELEVAAIFVRAGYRIEWLSDVTRRLPEFIARRQGSEVEIVVEAKSRPRPGLLGRGGERLDEDSVRADLARLHRDALEKETEGRPYVIFLDMNLPPRDDIPLDEWIPNLHDDVLAWRGKSSPENPDPYSAVVLTNFSWHWHGEDTTKIGERFLVLPLYADVPLPESETDRIWESVTQYGVLPQG